VDTPEPDAADTGFLSFAETAVNTTVERLPTTDPRAMQLILLLYRITNAVVYDLESTVHRPAGWSWSAFRLVFTLWVSGPLESRQAAQLSGMSRAAVSSLTNTLVASGMLERSPDPRDGRGVLLSLTEQGREALETTFRAHNEREAEWAALLTPEELDTLNTVLGKLAAAASTQEWVNRR
jgi:DNA-binding MarR family transcriptional regulator